MKLKFTILGSGSSLGVPRIDGNFGKCNPKNKKNFRSRCSALLSIKNYNILIDSSPDIRYQFLKNNIRSLDSVFYTHEHADQTHGINDLRFFYLKKRKQIPVYANKRTAKYLLSSFNYCFKKNGGFYPPIMTLKKLKNKHSFFGNKITIKSFEVKHGSINSVCYIFNDKIAIEGGVGFVTENYLRQFIQESVAGQTRQMKYGPSFVVSGRYYPFKRAEVIYCKAEIKFRRYKELYQQINNIGDFESIKEYEQRIMPRFGMGYHLFLDQHFFLDLGANIGLTFIQEYQFGYDDALKNTRFHFGIDFKFAYAF